MHMLKYTVYKNIYICNFLGNTYFLPLLSLTSFRPPLVSLHTPSREQVNWLGSLSLFHKQKSKHAVRQGTKVQRVLLTLPGQVPSSPRRCHGLPSAQASRLPGQEQVPIAQVPIGGPIHQSSSHLPDCVFLDRW